MEPPSPHLEAAPLGVPLAHSLTSRWRATAPPEWLAAWNVIRIPVAGGEIEAVECGAGRPLVLLPPLPGWKEAFVALAPVLARHFRVLTFDLRSRFPAEPSWDTLVDDAESIVSAWDDGPVAVLGHSFGGALGLQWAVRHPERVRALVVSSGFARVTTPRGAWASRYLEQPLALAAMRLLPDSASAAVAGWLARRRRWVFDSHCDRAVVELVRAGIREVPLSLVRQRIRMALALDLRDRLPLVECPTLVLHGEHDTAFAREAGNELVRSLRGCGRTVVPEGGHLHPLSRASELGEIVGTWLARVAGVD